MNLTSAPATYMNHIIDEGILYADFDKGKVEVCVSIDEIDGTILTVQVPGDVLMVELDFTAARKLMLALQDALNIHANQPE